MRKSGERPGSILTRVQPQGRGLSVTCLCNRAMCWLVLYCLYGQGSTIVITVQSTIVFQAIPTYIIRDAEITQWRFHGVSEVSGN